MATHIKGFCVLFGIFFSARVEGHGYMLDPINRASLWRIDWTQPPNYNDNEYFCGGTHVQYVTNEGKCGPCGDDWRDPIPRSNENGGTFGNGIVVANYTAGQVIKVASLITANHLGSIYFQLCELKDPSQPETEECFVPLRLDDGTESRPIQHLEQKVYTKLKLPEDFTCDRCVLRWHYRTGNSWGRCDDGTLNAGCGDQEIFRSCADITINPKTPGDLPPPPEHPESEEIPPEVIPPNNNCNGPNPSEIPSYPQIPADPFKLIKSRV